MSLQKEQLLPFAAFLAHESASIIKKYYLNQAFSVQTKVDSSPVTQADKEAEAIMRENIEKKFPDHGIIGEEYGQHQSGADYVWVLDPIDGTKSFIHNVPLFGTIIGLLHQGKAILGCIHIPCLNILCIGDGETTTCNGEPVTVSPCTDLSKSLLLTSDVTHPRLHHNEANWNNLVDQVGLLRTWGDCFGYTLVARGQANIMVDPIAALWDFAGAIPIIEGAGAVITDWNGNEPLKGNSTVAAAPALHARVLEILNA